MSETSPSLPDAAPIVVDAAEPRSARLLTPGVIANSDASSSAASSAAEHSSRKKRKAEDKERGAKAKKGKTEKSKSKKGDSAGEANAQSTEQKVKTEPAETNKNSSRKSSKSKSKKTIAADEDDDGEYVEDENKPKGKGKGKNKAEGDEGDSEAAMGDESFEDGKGVDKAAKRKDRNRISAKKSRARKKQYVSFLEQTVAKLQIENGALRNSVDAIRDTATRSGVPLEDLDEAEAAAAAGETKSKRGKGKGKGKAMTIADISGPKPRIAQKFAAAARGTASAEALAEVANPQTGKLSLENTHTTRAKAKAKAKRGGKAKEEAAEDSKEERVEVIARALRELNKQLNVLVPTVVALPDDQGAAASQAVPIEVPADVPVEELKTALGSEWAQSVQTIQRLAAALDGDAKPEPQSQPDSEPAAEDGDAAPAAAPLQSMVDS